MHRNIMNLAAAIASLLVSASVASAQSTEGSVFWVLIDATWDGGGTTSSQVPEIDASTGLMALAASLAALALAWELKRRRSRG